MCPAMNTRDIKDLETDIIPVFPPVDNNTFDLEDEIANETMNEVVRVMVTDSFNYTDSDDLLDDDAEYEQNSDYETMMNYAMDACLLNESDTSLLDPDDDDEQEFEELEFEHLHLGPKNNEYNDDSSEEDSEG